MHNRLECKKKKKRRKHTLLYYLAKEKMLFVFTISSDNSNIFPKNPRVLGGNSQNFLGKFVRFL